MWNKESLDKIILWNTPFILLFVALGVYHNNLTGPFVYDDIWQIVENPSLGEFPPPGNIWRLTTRSTFWLNYSWTGPIPERDLVTSLGGNYMKIWHFANIFLHACCALVFFYLLKFYFFPNKTPYLSLLASLLFLLHPLASEPVNYIQARAIICTTLFTLLALWHSLKPHKTHKFLAVLWIFLAVTSKEVALFYVFITFFLFHLFILKSHLPIKKLVKLSIVPLALFLWGLGPAIWERFSTPHHNLAAHIANQSVVFWHYLALIYFPHAGFLTFDHWYSYPQFPNTISLLLATIGIAGIVAAGVIWRKRSRVSFCIWWGLAIIAPYFAIPTFFPLVEYRAYPLLLPATLTVVYVVDSFRLNKKTLAVISVAVICFLGYQTFQRNKTWTSSVSLYQDVVDKGSKRISMKINLSTAHMVTGRVYWLFSSHKELAKTHWQEGERLAQELVADGINSASLLALFTSIALSHEIRGNYTVALKQGQNLLKFVKNQKIPGKDQSNLLKYLCAKCFLQLKQIKKARAMIKSIKIKGLPKKLQREVKLLKQKINKLK